jgi:PAS domain S-box-containing protein
MSDISFFELNPHPLIICEEETLEFLKVNDSFCALYPFTKQQISEDSVTADDLFEEEQTAKLRETLADSSTESEQKATVLKSISSHGAVTTVKVFVRTFKYRNASALLVSMVDISDQVEHSRKMYNRFDELSYHIQNTSLALIEWDSDFAITQWSQQAREISGYSKEEVIGKAPAFFDFGPNKEASKIEQSMREMLLGKRDRDQLEVDLKRKDGSMVSINIHSSALRNGDSKLQSVVTLVEDLTAYKKAQAKLRRSEQMFKKLFTNAPQAIVMVDAQNKVLGVNNSFENLFGYRADELLGNDLNRVIRAAEGYEDAPIINGDKPEESEIYAELKRYTKQGKELNLVVGGIPVYLDGELIAGFGIYIDMTGPKKIEQQLQQSLDEKQVLLEEVHHRVKNNLAVVSGLLQMQTMHVDDPRLTKYIQNSQLRIRSMAIVHEMLYESATLSQIEMSSYVKKLTDVIAKTLGPDNKDIIIKVESDAITLNVNQAIPCALIISELITNAYEYAFEGQGQGSLHITVTKKEQQITIAVEDDGIGLPDNFDEMRKKSLGLSLIENLCRQLETDIEIDSGKWGTKFSFAFEKNDASGSSSTNRM